MKNKWNYQNSAYLILALAAGCLLPLAFAPYGIYIFAFLSPAALLYAWLRSKPKHAFFQGLLFGIGFFSFGVYWVFISINVYGNTPFFISIFITALFILVLSLYPAILGYLLVKLFGKKHPAILSLCVFPAMWVIWEWLRGTLFTGFPWLFLGYTQLQTPLHGLGPVFGVYGISLAIAFISGCLNVLVLREIPIAKYIAVFSIFGLMILGWVLSDHQWTKLTGKPVQVSLVQGNIHQQIKWQPKYFLHILDTYKNLTLANLSSRLIIWPEAAIPAFDYQVKPYLQYIGDQAKKRDDSIILGILILHQKTNQYYNGMLLIGSGHGKYLKRHLVPFGEYLPLKPLFNWFIKYFQIPMSSFTAGPMHQKLLRVKHFSIATFICYEIAYPVLVLDSAENSNLMVTITDDSWFGDSIALNQQVEMSQMRALETGRYFLVSANTGITAIINPQGRFIKTAPKDKKTVLVGDVYAVKGKTPLMEWDYYPVIGIIILLLLIAIFTKKKNIT